MQIIKDLEFSAGHRLPGHEKCSRLHGHNYKVKIVITYNYERLIEGANGFIVDFGDIKKIINDKFDHKFLISGDDDLWSALSVLPGISKVGYIPTAENIALDICTTIEKSFQKAVVREGFPTIAYEIKTVLNETSTSQVIRIIKQQEGWTCEK